MNERLRRTAVLALCACTTFDVRADTTALTISDASVTTSGTAATLQFPIARGGDNSYPAIISYHTSDGTAVAGTDYTAISDSVTMPPGVSSISLPVAVAANASAGPAKTFELSVDSVTGVGAIPTFSAAQSFLSGAYTAGIAAADINGDGKLDLIVASVESPNNTVAVRLNTTAPGAATPSFASRKTFDTKTGFTSVAVADINGDGRPDIIVTDETQSDIEVLINTTIVGGSTPSFAAAQLFLTGSTGSAPRSITAADINGDGRPDLIVANYGSSNGNTVAVLINTTAPGSATATFSTAQPFSTGIGAISVAAADINGDGKLDLVVANETDATVSVLINNTTPGSTTPSFNSQQTFATGAGASWVAAADVNGDGKSDLIVANRIDNTVSVLLNATVPGAAVATLAAQTTFVVGSQPVSVSVADVNGDGKPDLIVANSDPDSGNSLSVLVNISAVGGTIPNFALQQTLAPGTGPTLVISANINGDGKPDLIVATSQSITGLAVLLNTTGIVAPGTVTLGFAAPQTFSTGLATLWVTTDDINGDGKPDLITNKSVRLNTTAVGADTPSFGPEKALSTGSNPYSVATADIDGDGRPDVIVTNDGDNTVSVLLNTTAPGANDSTFATQVAFATGIAPDSIIVADVNGDGRPDLVVANVGSNTVSVLLNITSPGDTVPTFVTQATFATGNQPRSLVATDVNGDGKPDLIVGNSLDATVSVLLNTTAAKGATATFAGQTAFSSGSNPGSVTTADLNGDGLADIIVASESANTIAVLLNMTTNGAGTPSFASQQTFAAGNQPGSVSTGDLYGDGAVEVIVTNLASSTISVLRNTTTPGAVVATFDPQQGIPVSTQTMGLATADINSDGKLDLIATVKFGDSVQVLLNTTAPAPGVTSVRLAAQTKFATGATPQSVGSADLNADGKPDVFVVNSGVDTVSVLLNATAPGTGISSFAAQQKLGTQSDPNSAITADLNGDGKPDLIVANSASDSVSVLLNTTTPGSATITTAPPQSLVLPPGSFPYALAAADFNGDGKADLIVSNAVAGSVSVFMNTTSPGAGVATFATQQAFTVGASPQSVTAADINGDGKPDLIVANRNDNTLSVLLNATTPGSSTAVFGVQNTFAVGAYPRTVIAADINGDGKPDLIVANSGANTVSVLLNTTLPGAALPTFTQQNVFLSASYGVTANSVVAADVDGDGKVDLLVANYKPQLNSVGLLMNTTPPGALTASFATRRVFDLGSDPVAVAVADINGDGKPDVVAANNGEGNISVLLNNQYRSVIAGSPAIGTILRDDVFRNGFE